MIDQLYLWLQSTSRNLAADPFAVVMGLTIGTLIGLPLMFMDAWQYRRDRRASAARLAALRRAAQDWHPAATGPTERLACCETPDYPEDTVCCISCGKAVRS